MIRKLVYRSHISSSLLLRGSKLISFEVTKSSLYSDECEENISSERYEVTEGLNTLLTHSLSKILEKIPADRNIENLQI
jgi:hypothetical protein